MYAVIESGGRQYKVAVGEVIEVNRLPAEIGQTIDLDRVLMVGGAEGSNKVGQPVVPGAVVRARVAGHPRSRKIIVFHYKPKVRYRRMNSHRQDLTRLVIKEIVTEAPAISEITASAPVDTEVETNVPTAAETEIPETVSTVVEPETSTSTESSAE